MPTLLIYHGGEMVHRITGLGELGGQRATADSVEWVLSRHGAVTTELDEDPRKKLVASGGSFGRGFGRRGDDEDDD